MNGASPEMMHSLGVNCGPRDQFLYGDEFGVFDNFLVKPDPGSDEGWPEMGTFGGFGFGPIGLEEKQREGSKKRKPDKNHNIKVAVEKNYKEKKMKSCSDEGDSKITEQKSNDESKVADNNNKKNESSPENSKISEVQKPDYIHVRARRGQATDSHSLAERVRREKISERMKYLQDLVPGCNKITGKAGMLDEIINYVQSLQKQVEFLSMKLASVNPTLDFNIENFFAKEVFSPNFPIGVSPEMINPSFLQFNQLEQLVSCSGFDMGLNTSDVSLRRTVSASPETFLDSSTIFNQIQSSANWDANLQSLNYGMEFIQGRSSSFPSHQFEGSNEANNMKMEMM